MDSVERARSLVGSCFRPQGRDPVFGLDCVGLVCAVYGIAADAVPRNYRLRGASFERLSRELLRFFDRVAAGKPGDVMAFRVAASQLHLGVLTDRGLVHADAALREVVERPGPAPWPIIAAFRHKDY